MYRTAINRGICRCVLALVDAVDLSVFINYSLLVTAVELLILFLVVLYYTAVNSFN